MKEQAVVEQELELATPIPNTDTQIHDFTNRSRTDVSSQPRTDTIEADESVTSATTGISELQIPDHLEDQEHDVSPHWLENGTIEEKEKWLQSLFPTIESVQINDTVTKCDGDPQKCIDELLNLSFIHDDADRHQPEPKPVLKGIEGFVTEGTNGKGRKGKSKKNRRRNEPEDLYASDGTTSSGAVTPNTNIWDSAAHDVEFIVSRTQSSTSSIKSSYHENGANLALTIRALITKEAESNFTKIKSDDILQIQAAELKEYFETVPDKYIYGALLFAQMLPSAAKDLLDAMTTQSGGVYGHGRLVPQYTPVNLSEDEKPKKRPTSLSSPIAPADAALLIGRAGAHGYHADRAFTQASSAYRRGKSDHLYGGAAAYYASVGHERRKKEKELLASAADAWVGQQSTSDSLDLHGVTVEQAVRISRTRVENWWERLGDRKYVIGGIGGGYRIITGVGTHSAQGIGRIGPAVSKMLLREGWKVNIQRGEIIVEGRARRT